MATPEHSTTSTLRRIEEKIDALLAHIDIEKKLDLLLQDRLDKEEVRGLTRKVGRMTRQLQRAIEDASDVDSVSSNLVSRQESVMSIEMDALVAKVRELETVQDSAIALVVNLAQRVRDTAGDREAALALANDIDAQKQEMVDAITANTPVENPPPGPAPSAAPKGGKKV